MVSGVLKILCSYIGWFFSSKEPSRACVWLSVYIFSKFYSTGISPKTKDLTLSPELQRCTAANTPIGCRMAAALSERRAKNAQSWGPDWMEQSLFSVLLWKWSVELSISTVIWKHPVTQNCIERTTLFLLSGMKYETKFLLVRNMFGENDSKHLHTHHWLQISLQWLQSKDFGKDFFFKTSISEILCWNRACLI